MSPARPQPASTAQELIDTRPYARAWHYHIVNDRSLYGLPRKFNVGFDGGGVIPVLEDTNDIAFTAVTRRRGSGRRAGRVVPARDRRHHRTPGFRQVLGRLREARGCSGGGRRHRARLHRPRRPHGPQEGAPQVRARCLGPRQVPHRGRSQARPPLVRLSADQVSAPNRQDRQAHVGIHAQRQAGKVWAGVVLPVGKVTLRADARPRQNRARARRRRYSPHRLAEPADLRHRRRRNAALVETCLDEIGLTSKADQRPRRPRRLHGQHGVQVRALQHQGHGDGDRRLGGAARRSRQPRSTST